MTSSVVKVMWDYDAFPLWVVRAPAGQVSSGSVPLPEELREDLQEWSDEMTALMWGSAGPDRRRTSPPRDELVRLVEAGRALAVRLRASLDETWTVSYVDELLDEEVVVESPRPPVIRRHGKR